MFMTIQCTYDKDTAAVTVVDDFKQEHRLPRHCMSEYAMYT